MVITFKKNSKKKEFYIPDGWNALTLKQATQLAELTANYTPVEAITRFFLFCNKLIPVQVAPVQISEYETAHIYRHKNKRYMVSDIDLSAIVNHYTWIYNANKVIDPMLTRSILNKIRVGKTVLLPPDDALTNVRYGQYTHADVHFKRFIKTAHIEHLNKLLAALYVPKGELFNANTYLMHLSAIGKLSFATKNIMLWYFIGSKRLLARMFPLVFSSSSSEKPNEPAVDPYLEYMQLTSSMCEGANDIASVKEQLVWDVFAFLEEKIRQHNISIKK